ncbi:MAG: hypothetical protein CVT98_06800 [Bacteroidetes bacterium HGW-Bacteroidetes-15]|nr:MAG: hypothetical protein CVT98_06800 [Bacteroidetes bacterium HGW-Bacteroidetes-15]
MKKTLLPILVFAIASSSCTTTYYVPNSATVPLLREKGEKQVAITMGTSDYTINYGISGAFAISNNIGTIVNATYINGGEADGAFIAGDYNPNRKGSMAELGIGYYKAFPTNNRVVFETYLGYGFLKGNVAVNNTQSISYQIHRPFIQPSFGYTSKYLDAALGLRLVQIYYSNVNPSQIFADDAEALNLFYSLDKKILFEPSLTIRVGVESIKLQLQFLTSTHSNVSHLPIDGVNLSAGLHFKF